MDIGELFRAIPTKDGIQQILANLEETHRRETQDLRGEITSIATLVEAVAVATDTRISALERAHARQEAQMTQLQLHVEDLEDRGR